MALAKVIAGSKLLVMVGDGADPEVFAHPCLINLERGIDFDAETNDIDTPDCDDPEAPAWKTREKKNFGVTISGAGKHHTPNTEEWFLFWKSNEGKNIRFKVDAPGAEGGGYWAGEFLCTRYSLKGTRGDKADVDITLLSNGEVVWVDAA